MIIVAKLSYIVNVVIICNERHEAWEKVKYSTEKLAVLGFKPMACCMRTGWRLVGCARILANKARNHICSLELGWNLRAGGPEMTKDSGAHVTCHHHLGIIWVTSHRMKVLEHVGISYMSNAKSCRGPSWRVYDEDGINNILPDDGRFDARMMWLRVWEKASPRTMTSWMITSSDMESETRRPDDWGNPRN